MKIRLMVQMTGARGGVDWPAVGSELEVSDYEGAKFCRNGWAVPIVELEPEVKTATVADTSEKRVVKPEKPKEKST